MYTVSKAPTTKMAARTRRGLTQKLEGLDAYRELSRKSSSEPSPPSSPEMSSPKPVFSERRKQHARLKSDSPNISPQHEEIIRYLAHTWRRVKEDSSTSQDSGGEDIESLYYQQMEVHPALLDFEPFDLEQWWGRRLYQQLTGTTS